MVMATPEEALETGDASVQVLGNLLLNLRNYRVVVGAEVVDLTFSELELLQVFFRQPDRVIPYSEIAEAIWGNSDHGSIRHLNVLVHRLRSKLSASHPFAIETVRGRGYGLLKSREAEQQSALGIATRLPSESGPLSRPQVGPGDTEVS